MNYYILDGENHENQCSQGGTIMDYYILDGEKVIPCHDLRDWAMAMTKSNTSVARNEIRETIVSTVFLGIDHAFDAGKPLLFETMVFGGELDQEQVRYTTKKAAKKGHKKMVERVKRTQQTIFTRLIITVLKWRKP